MNKYVYIQNSKFEWLHSTFLHEAVFAPEKLNALELNTEEKARHIATLCGIKNFYIVTMRYIE